MADTVDSLVMFSGKRRYKVRLTNVSDGTGEAAVVKVDRSTLTNLNGVEPTRIAIERIDYDISGMSIRLHWDHTTDDEIAVLSGVDSRCYSPPLVDPNSTGGTGDVLLTTVGHTAADTYDITLHCVLL
jgi:hypothetical protein